MLAALTLIRFSYLLCVIPDDLRTKYPRDLLIRHATIARRAAKLNGIVASTAPPDPGAALLQKNKKPPSSPLSVVTVETTNGVGVIDGVTTGAAEVAVGGTGVEVRVGSGSGVSVAVAVGGGGVGVLVGGTGVSVGTRVLVGGIGVSVGSGVGVSVGSGVSVGIGVSVGTGVSVGSGVGVSVGSGVGVNVGVGVSDSAGKIMLKFENCAPDANAPGADIASSAVVGSFGLPISTMKKRTGASRYFPSLRLTVRKY